MKKYPILGLSMTVSLSLLACGGGAGGDSEPGVDTTPGTPNTVATAPTPAANVRHVSVSGTARSLGMGDPLGAGAPLSGLSVCALDRGVLCTQTHSDGTFTLDGVAANSNPTLIFTKGGMYPTASPPNGRSIPFELGTEDAVVPAYESAFASASDVATLAGKPADPTKGSIAFFATELVAANSDAVEFASGVTVRVAGLGSTTPLFLDRSGKTANGATATAGSWGAFVDVPPGNYQVTFKHPTTMCRAVDADSKGNYGFNDEQTIDVTVVAGGVSGPLQVFCPYAGAVAE